MIQPGRFSLRTLPDNLGFFFSEVAQRSPDRCALIDLFGGREKQVSYGDLDARASRAGAMLRDLDLNPGDRVALLLGNRSEFIEVFFGAMRAGLVPVPLNIKQPAASLAFMIADAGCRGAVVDPESLPKSEGLVTETGVPVRVVVGRPESGAIAYEEALRTAPPLSRPETSPDGIAFQPYTAGSTGRPKGVRLTHAGMMWSVRSTQELWPMAETEVGLVAVPLFHKNAMRGTIKPTLFAGARAVIMPRFEPRAFLDALARHRVTFVGGVPAIFSMLLEHRDLIEKLDFSALQLFAIGSAVVPAELVSELERAFPGVAVKESYGLTEGGGPLRAPLDGRDPPRGSCGTAAPGYEVMLVDSEGNRGAEVGELWTRNPCVTAGYHNLPALTEERIVDGWLRTGDVFRRDRDGFYFFLGRLDDMFSCGGENIYPKEVEDVLLAHPAVRDACVAPVSHDVKGFVPGAMVVLHAGSTASAEELKAFSFENGPAYAHPRRILIVDQLPLSGAGKPDRKAVQERLETGTLPRVDLTS
jgi:acyl-CoA synthetase (AMP-forming)/AMP-acid ligase II